VIGLDTNILIRYLTQDDAAQSRKATEIIESRLSEVNPGFVSVVAMAETVWVLDRAYGFASLQIAVAVERMLQIEVLVIENEQQVRGHGGAQAGARVIRRRSDNGAWCQSWLHPYPYV